MTQITAPEKRQLDCQLKHRAGKNKLTSVLQHRGKLLKYYKDGPARKNVASVEQLPDPSVTKVVYYKLFSRLVSFSINKLSSLFWERSEVC